MSVPETVRAMTTKLLEEKLSSRAFQAAADIASLTEDTTFAVAQRLALALPPWVFASAGSTFWRELTRTIIEEHQRLERLGAFLAKRKPKVQRKPRVSAARREVQRIREERSATLRALLSKEPAAESPSP